MNSLRLQTIGFLFAMVSSSAALAQLTPLDPSIQLAPPGGSAFDNASGGAVAARAPGNLVIAGVAQALNAADVARARVEIVETEVPTSIGDELLADTIEIVFDQLNEAIVMFENLLRLRAGRPISIPTNVIPDSNSTDR